MGEIAMYVNGFILAVPEGNKAAYIDVAERFWELVKEYGALSQVECWEDDVKDGHTTDFRRAVQCEDGEKIVVCTLQKFGWLQNVLGGPKGIEGKRFAIIVDEAHSSQTGEAVVKPPPYVIRGRRRVVAQRQDLDGFTYVGRAVRDDVLRRSRFPIEHRELGALLRICRDADASRRQYKRHRAAAFNGGAIRFGSALASERLEEARRWRGVRPQRRTGRAVEQNTRDGRAERIHKRLDVPGRPARGEDYS